MRVTFSCLFLLFCFAEISVSEENYVTKSERKHYLMCCNAQKLTEYKSLSPILKNLIDVFFQPGGNPESSWNSLTTSNNGRAAAVLAITTVLRDTTIGICHQKTIPALDLVKELKIVAEDRLLVYLDKPLFYEWLDNGARYSINVHGKKPDSGKIWFESIGLGGSIHKGFDAQGVTSIVNMPRIQLNFRACDSLADIDIDGYSPFVFWKHLTYANSDSRQWQKKYQKKFAPPGFKAKKDQGVKPDRVETLVPCPRSDKTLKANELELGTSLAEKFISGLNRRKDFVPVMNELMDIDFLQSTLKDVEHSPLLSVVEQEVIRDASTQQLMDYYVAQLTATFFKLLTVDDQSLEKAIIEEKDEEPVDVPISSVEKLNAATERLRKITGQLKSQTLKKKGLDFEKDEIHVWNIDQEQASYKLAPGARLLIVDLPFHQLLVRSEVTPKILIAVPKSLMN